MANHVEHSLSVKLVLTDGYSEHELDSGMRLTRSEVNRIGFRQISDDLTKMVAAYKSAPARK